jgi:hypothetical protein
MKVILDTFFALTLWTWGFSPQAPPKSETAADPCPPFKSCKKPVKWLADKNDCSCFACEYGKPSQHIACTKDPQTKASLINLQTSTLTA